MDKKLKIFYLIIIVLTLLDILCLVNVMLYPVSLTFKRNVFIFDLLLCVILWIEFIYSYLHAEDRKQYLRDNLLSVLGMLPIDFIFLRALRLIKFFQLIKIFILGYETEGKISRFLQRTYLDKTIFLAIIFIFVITILITIVESDISDIHVALWYIIVSMTSTGYGDIIPSTTSGRVLGVVAMVGGILIFATFTAIISSIYVSVISKDHHDDLESRIDDLTSEIAKLNKKIDELNKKEK